MEKFIKKTETYFNPEYFKSGMPITIEFKNEEDWYYEDGQVKKYRDFLIKDVEEKCLTLVYIKNHEVGIFKLFMIDFENNRVNVSIKQMKL